MHRLWALLRRIDFFAPTPTGAWGLGVIFLLVPLLGFLGVRMKFALTDYELPYRAVAYAAIGISFFLAGSLIRLWHSPSPPRFLRAAWDPRRLAIVFGIVFGLGFAAKAVRLFLGGYKHLDVAAGLAQSPWFGVLGFLNWISPLAIAMAFAAFFSFRREGHPRVALWRIIAWSTLFFEVLFAIPSCGRKVVLVPILLFLIVQWYLDEKKYLIFLFAGAFAVLFLFPWGSVCRDIGILRPYELAGNDGAVTLDTRKAAEFAADSFLDRLDQSVVFSYIIDYTDRTGLFLSGRSLIDFFVILGPPRFLWTGKPPSVNASGNELGRAIGVLSPDDYRTSIGPTILGDWYMNFGIAGIMAGMFLMGWLFRFVYDLLIVHSGRSPAGVMLYAIVWVHTMSGVEGFIAPTFAGLTKLLIFTLIASFFLARRPEQN